MFHYLQISHNLLDSRTSLFVRFIEALHPGQQFFSHFGTASWLKPVLSNGDEVSCSRTQHCALGVDRTHNLAIKSRRTSLFQFYGGHSKF